MHCGPCIWSGLVRVFDFLGAFKENAKAKHCQGKKRKRFSSFLQNLSGASSLCVRDEVYWTEDLIRARAVSVPGLLCQSGRRRPENKHSVCGTDFLPMQISFFAEKISYDSSLWRRLSITFQARKKIKFHRCSFRNINVKQTSADFVL